MNKKLKITLWTILIVLIAIQFVPVDRENPKVEADHDFLVATQAPEQIQHLFKSACYDCHSNETVWPLYSYVAPVSLIVGNHVVEGREHLNFSNWTIYDSEDHPGILKHIKKEITNNAMPLAGYTLLHPEAKLSDEQKTLIIDYIDLLIEKSKVEIEQ